MQDRKMKGNIDIEEVDDKLCSLETGVLPHDQSHASSTCIHTSLQSWWYPIVKNENWRKLNSRLLNLYNITYVDVIHSWMAKEMKLYGEVVFQHKVFIIVLRELFMDLT